MNRRSLVPLAGLLLGGCWWMPGMEDPRVTIRPVYAAYELTGDTSLQSRVGSTIVDNSPNSVNEFAAGERGDDWGGELSIGNGFSGFDFAYLKLDMHTTKVGRLGSGWGALAAGDQVRTKFFLEEFRLRYIAGLIDLELHEDWRLQIGAGGALAHREATFEAVELNAARKQKIKFSDDGVLYGGGRARLGYKHVFVDVDYMISPDLTFGGDFTDTLQDLELKAGWRFEDQDVELIAGWRFSEFPAEGTQDGLRFDADFGLEGFFAMLSVRF
jgi:hypothetical protein